MLSTDPTALRFGMYIYQQLQRILSLPFVLELAVSPVNRRTNHIRLRGPARLRYRSLADFVNRRLRNLAVRDRRVHVPRSLDLFQLRDGVHLDHRTVGCMACRGFPSL